MYGIGLCLPRAVVFFQCTGDFPGTPETKLPAGYELKGIPLLPVYSSPECPAFLILQAMYQPPDSPVLLCTELLTHLGAVLW